MKKSKNVEEKVSAASDGVIAPEESDLRIGAKRWESSLFKVDQELTGKDGKLSIRRSYREEEHD